MGQKGKLVNLKLDDFEEMNKIKIGNISFGITHQLGFYNPKSEEKAQKVDVEFAHNFSIINKAYLHKENKRLTLSVEIKGKGKAAITYEKTDSSSMTTRDVFENEYKCFFIGT